MKLICENHHEFVTDHSAELNSPRGALRMLQDNGMFNAYIDQLVEGIQDKEILSACRAVCNREREMILESNVPAGAAPNGWVVMSFPILVDIYNEPNISKLCNVYPVDKPMISVPRLRIVAETTSYDGRSVERTYIPTATKNVQSGIMEVNISPDSITNVFTSTVLDQDRMKMNRRFTLLSKIIVTEEDTAGTVINTFTVPVNFKPDNRQQINNVFTFNDTAHETVVGHVSGNIDFNKANVQFHVNFDGGTPGNTYSCSYGVFKLKFIPVKTMNGRTKVTVENEMLDLVIDPNEDFLIDLTEEEMQDYGSIFKLDIVRTLTEAIKRQMLLNKDSELAYFLKAAEPDIQRNGAMLNLNLQNFTAKGGTGDYTPNGVRNVMEAIIPRISTLYSTIRKNFNIYPTYMVTGFKAAAFLRALQDFSITMASTQGDLGFSGSTAQFNKLQILESPAIEDDTIYMSTKAPSNALETSTIVDFIHQPLYIVKETTDGNTIHFVRARTLIEVLRADGLGCLKVSNMEPFIG